ncbi:MAG: TonB-dependent receptor [Gammaproteobacteria bacterium]|nr:MAG: TonB-dependent receptor [Gammaproteobacteria bacterium]
MYKKSPLASAISLAIASGSMGVSPYVLAQDTVAEEEPIENIVVTGSRIKRDGFSTSAPMDVVLTDTASVSGISDIGTLIQQSTAMAGGPQVTAATSTAFVQNGGAGAQTASIRGLGANRTLTLINGRRAGPAGTRGGVSSFDLNVIPLIAVERIEILKDGASSIYGSDAVAGVVNIFTKKEDGGSIDAYISQPGDSGGEESRLSATWGRSWDRGNFRLTADYNKISELARGDRDYFNCAEQYIFDAAGNRADVVDPRTGSFACNDTTWGHVWLYDYQGAGGNVPTSRFTLAQYDYDGDLGQYIPGIAVDPNNPDFLVAPPDWFLVSYDRQSDGVTNRDHVFQDAQTMIPELEKTTFFGDGEFHFTDSMSGYAEVLLNRRKTTSNDYRQFWSYVYNENFFAGNPLSAGWTGAQWLSPTAITDHFDNVTEVEYQRYVAGIRGDFTESWSYDLSYQYSHSSGDYTQDQIYADSVEDQNWLSGSCVGTNTSVRGVPCQDIPWLDPQFLAGNIDPGMRDFLFGVETGNTVYKQSSWEGFITGPIFELPAGEVGLAFGFHLRDDDIHDVPGDITRTDDTGNVNNGWGISSAGITTGDQRTKAVFAEVDIPILADLPGVRSLDLSASYRYNDVDTYGTGDTYKVGLNWAITDSIRVRATQGTSFRTPALFELFLADQTSFIRQSNIDPCIEWGQQLNDGNISQRTADNCAADTKSPLYPNGLPPDYQGGSITATAISQGGLGRLDAETSTSNTYGIIWQPEFANLSVSLDYFDIEIEDQIDQLGAQVIAGQCYDSEFFPDDQLCDLFDRSSVNGGIDNVEDSFINVANQKSRGYDVALRYALEVAGGTLEFDTQHTFQEERNTALFGDDVRDQLGRFGFPEHVGRLWTTYDKGDWSFFWGARFVGSVSSEEDFDGSSGTYRGEDIERVLYADSIIYHDFSVTYYMDRWGLRTIAGVSNAFDENPPQVTTLGGPLSTAGKSAFYSQYDWLGTRFFLNLTMTFD